ncbi:MAG: hypothetical protein MK033_12480 [Candidatus Caenarcaniphilales bacterium]|nr:hypothetical protein [Candidatus Caenarcaniphilales bacterium]
MVEIKPGAFYITNPQSKLSEGMEYVPEFFLGEDVLGEDGSKEVLDYANELKVGNTDNLGKLISLLEKVSKTMPKSKSGEVRFFINDIVDTAKNPKIRGELIAAIDESSSLKGLFTDKKDANTRDYYTTKASNFLENNQAALRDELKDLNNGKKTGPKLQEMIKMANLYTNDGDKQKFLHGVFASYQDMGFNVKEIKGNEVTKVGEHQFNAKNHALDSDGKNILETQEKFVKVDGVTTASKAKNKDDEDDDDEKSSSGKSKSDIDMSSILFAHGPHEDAEYERIVNGERTLHGQHRHINHHWHGPRRVVHNHDGLGPHAHHVRPGADYYNQHVNSGGIFGDIDNIFTQGLGFIGKRLSEGYAIGNIFNGRVSNGFNIGTNGFYSELRSTPSYYEDYYAYGGGYADPYYHQPFPVNYGAVTGQGRGIEFNPVINIDNTSSANANPYVNQTGAPIAVNTNTPVSVPNHNLNSHLGLPFYG